MATRTLGTAATTTLTALAFQRGGLAQADIAAIAQGVKDDGGTAQGTTGPFGTAGVIWPDAFNSQGLLIVPNRGILQVYPGDFVAVDASGWPILLSALAAASASWVHT